MQTAYHVLALLPDGYSLSLDDAVIGLTYGHERGEIAQRAVVTLARIAIGNGRTLDSALALCTRITIFAGGTEVMRGLVWDFALDMEHAHTVTITVYDDFIYAQKSKDNFYFKKGKLAGSVIASICEKWGIPLSYEWLAHKCGKLMYRGGSISDAILQTLERVRLANGKRYVCLMEKGVLRIMPRGTNKTVYSFSSANGSVAGVRYGIGLDELITRVIVTGKEEDGRVPVKATLDGRTEYGILQQILDMGDMTLKRAKREARYLLDDYGTPLESIRIGAPDVPEIRKGDKIKCYAGPLGGEYIVLAISHDAGKRYMEMEVEAAREGE